VRQLTPQSRFPDARTLDWVARAVGPGARVVGGRRLMGGITSSIHRLAVETRRGTRIQVILRRWTPSVWDTAEDAPQLVERECHVLRGLESTDIPAPRVLAVDPTGEATGVPALLMTRLPGRMDLTPTDPQVWLRQIAGMAVRIHDLDIDAEPYRWEEREVPIPAWTSRPADWRAAAGVVGGPAPAHEVRFAHGDYQHFNFLWQRGRLMGVVDWVAACRGPADVDVGHCRLNLAILYSAQLAADFLAAYEAEAGRRVDPYWDIRCATAPAFDDWAAFIPIQVGRRAPFDGAGMHRRVDDLLAAALRRT
jgi:aminoglycoside phosphotransferase (APT) family kinase protein